MVKMSFDIRVDLPGTFVLKERRFERLIRLLEPLMVLREPALIQVDLDRMVSIGPASLALLTATLRRLYDEGLFAEGSVLEPPRSPGLRNYLMRMNLLRGLFGDDSLDEPITRAEARGFRPCAVFSNDEDYWQVAKQMTAALVESCEVDEIATAAVRVCLDEMTENVVHHASAAHGFAAAQGWRKTHEFEIGIVDLGRGIRASLTANPDYADIDDDVSAITTALGARVSATPERNAGIGLYVTKMLLAANGGAFLVRSGSGAVYSGATNEARAEPAVMPGTFVALRARTDRPLDVNAIYTQLENDDPGPDTDDD